MQLIKTVEAMIKNPLLPDSETIASNPTSYANNALQTFISILIIVGIIFFILRFIFGAYKIISSNGDPKKKEEAMGAISSSLIGIVVIFSVFVILRLIGTVFGITGLSGSSLTLPWPTL